MFILPLKNAYQLNFLYYIFKARKGEVIKLDRNIPLAKWLNGLHSLSDTPVEQKYSAKEYPYFVSLSVDTKYYKNVYKYEYFTAIAIQQANDIIDGYMDFDFKSHVIYGLELYSLKEIIQSYIISRLHSEIGSANETYTKKAYRAQIERINRDVATKHQKFMYIRRNVLCSIEKSMKEIS